MIVCLQLTRKTSYISDPILVKPIDKAATGRGCLK